MITSCTCVHADQDKLYGKGNRVFNSRANNKAPRCTVCGKDAKGDFNSKKPKEAAKKAEPAKEPAKK